MRVVAMISSVVLSTLFAVSARATTIDVQWNGGTTVMTGAAAVGSAGDSWNQVTQENITNQALTDVAGNAVGSGVTVTVADPGGGIGPYGGLVNSPASIAPLFSSILYNTTDTQPTVFTFSNVPQGTYDLYLYQGTDNNGEDRVSTGVANGVSGTVGPENGQANVSLFATPYNYIELPSVVVGSDGNLVLNYASANGGESDLDGLQLISAPIAVPEPSSLILLGIGCIGACSLIAGRRNRSES